MEFSKKKICPDCLSNYKKSKLGKSNRALGILWGKNNWHSSVYHLEPTRKCFKHHAQALVDSANRRALKINATSSWADKKKLKVIYSDCMMKSQSTGVAHEVDHIVPLKGKNVCGLHNEFNLRIVTASENRAKSNKF